MAAGFYESQCALASWLTEVRSVDAPYLACAKPRGELASARGSRCCCAWAARGQRVGAARTGLVASHWR
jgi:hypothetical protein